jgi:hypothetical protein
VIALAAGVIVLALALVIERREGRQERAEWTRERQLLLTRIQHPEIVVASPDSPEILPDEDYMTAEPDEADLVGTVQLNGSNGD